MKIYKFLFAVIILTIYQVFIASCSSIKGIKIPETQVRGLEILQVFPAFREDWTVSQYDTISIFIYTLHQKILLDFPHRYYLNPPSDSSVIQHTYVVYSKNSKSGIRFTTFPKEHEEIVMLDSVFKYMPKTNLTAAYFSSDSNNVILLNKIKDTIAGSLEEKYYISKKKDSSKNQVAVFRYSDKVTFEGYSLSPALDSIKKMKLVKFEVIIPAKYYPEYKKTQSSFSIAFSIREIESKNKKDVMSYFEKFSPENKKKIN